MISPTKMIERELWRLFLPVPHQSNEWCNLENVSNKEAKRDEEIWIKMVPIEGMDPFEEFKVNVVCKYVISDPLNEDGVRYKEIFNSDIKVNARKLEDINVMTAQKFHELSYFIYSNIRTLWRTMYESK